MVMQGLLGNLAGGLLRGIGPRQAPAQRTGVAYGKHLEITDGDADYETEAQVVAIVGALAAGSVWTKIWEKTVEAQTQYRWGFGSPATPHNQGYLFFVSLDETSDFQVGMLRIVQARANEWTSRVVKEFDDRRLHGTTVTSSELATPHSIDEMQALPEKVEFPKVGEDSMLQLWYRCIVAATAEDACAFCIPVTVYQL